MSWEFFLMLSLYYVNFYNVFTLCQIIARILSAGVHFLLDQKSDDLFLVITLSYMVIYVIYCHQLPFYLICGGAPHQIQPHFCLIPTKIPRKIFVIALWVHLHPLYPLATPMVSVYTANLAVSQDIT